MQELNRFNNCLKHFRDQKDQQEKEPVSVEALQVSEYLKREEIGLMKSLSMIARSMAAPAPEEPGLIPPSTMDNSLLSEVLIKTGWLNKKQLEPQNVLEYLAEENIQGKSVQDFTKNILSTVLIGRSEVLDADNMPIRYPLSDSKVTTTVLNADGMPLEHAQTSAFDWRFPFRNQPTVQRNLADAEGAVEPAFYGTGFFIRDNIVATAGHVVKEMIKTLKTNGKASFIIVQNYRLGIDFKSEIRRYDIAKESLEDWHGLSLDEEDWAYLKVEGKSDHYVDMVDSADCGKEVYCLGHGMGMPLKMGWNGLLFKIDNLIFRCKLETYSGNSGCPVFCANTHAVIGILSGTDKELYFQTEDGHGGRRVLPKVYLHGFNGAIFTKIGPLLERLAEETMEPSDSPQPAPKQNDSPH